MAPVTGSFNAEDAFTLIEMMVATFLLAIVFTMTLQFLSDAVDREREGVTSKRAMEKSTVALEQLGQDLRSAVSRDRATGGGLGLDDLDFVAAGYLPPPGAERDAFVNEKLDLISASAWRIQVMVPAAGETNCVAYEASPFDRGRMYRTVSSSCPANPGNTISREVVVGRAPVDVPVTPPFSYSAFDTSPSCRAQPLAPGSSFDALAGSGSMETLYRIASVHVNLRSTALAGTIRSTTKVSTDYVLRSRLSVPYRRALGAGCSE